MPYAMYAAAGVIVGIAICAAVFVVVWKGFKMVRDPKPKGKDERKPEFSKIVLALVLFTYFIGVCVGIKSVAGDSNQLGSLLMFIGGPTGVAIGFYSWKAKAENTIKIKKENPKETEGFPVDLNNMHS